MRTTIIVETCPACGSFDVQVAEPRPFRLDIDRSRLDAGWVETLDFGCRDCGTRWT